MKICISEDGAAQTSREAILEAVSFAAARFLGPHDWEEAVVPALARLGEATQVSRVSIFENHLGANTELLTSQRFVWAAPGIESHADNPTLQGFAWRGAGMDRWADALSAGQSIAGNVKDFPQSEQDILGALGILSAAIVPIFVHDAWWGFLGFKECRRERDWSRPELDALQICAGILGAAVQCKQAEKVLAEREQRFRALIQHSSDVAVILDADGTIRYVSESVEAPTGFSPDEYIGRSAFLLLHPDDLPFARQERESLLKSPQGVRRAEYRHRTKAGEWVFLEAAGTNCLHDPAINGFVLNIRDVTERKQAQESLATSERRFRTLVEKSSEGLCLLDSHYTILYQSPALLSIQGFTPEERNGRHALELVHPDDLTATETVLNGVRRTPGASSPLTTRLRHKDGSWRWQEAVISNHLDDPAVKALVVNLRDVTERMQTEEALNESERRLRLLADNLPSAVLFQLVADQQDVRRFTYVSDAVTRINEVSVEAVLADTMVLISQTLPEFMPGMEEAVQRALKGGSSFNYEFKALLPSGRIRWFELSASHRRLPDGRIVAEGVEMDITERKRVEDALRKSEEQYRGIFDESVAAIFLFDSAKRFVDSNQAGLDLLGYSREELIHMGIPDVDADPVVVLTAHEQLLSGGRLINYEHRLRR